MRKMVVARKSQKPLGDFIHQQRNRRDKKCRHFDNDFNNHADAAVQCGAHQPMKHNQGFT